jgi:uncharacterized membrane protein YdfJ with MMPL/SSD domain
VQTAVARDTVEDIDFTHQMKHGMPYVIAFVLAFAFIVLLVAFRSLVVPVKAIVLNPLSSAPLTACWCSSSSVTGRSRSSASSPTARFATASP